MDGFQTAAYIRNRLHSTTPIIAMTASALRNEKDRCLQIGMNEYLTKPFTPAVLFYHLRRYLLDNEEAAPQAMPAAPEQKGTDLYNLGYLEEMDDAEYASEVLDLFLSLTPPALTAIKEAAMREDWTEVHKKAHSLKSSLGILQMNQLLHNMAEIETLSKSRKNTDTIETLLQQAAQQYELVRPMLEAELQLTRKKLVL
jgi:CheY-like chemotaxis protein